MKVTQLHFTLTPKLSRHAKSKTHSSKVPVSSSIPNENPITSYFKSHKSNKRLKYYSTRNKDANDLIDDKNIQIFKEEFKKFQDMGVRTLPISKESSKKEVFNLIVKKYCKKNKLSNEFIDSKLKKQQQTNNAELNKVETENQSAHKEAQDKIESVNPEHIITEKHAQQYPPQIRRSLQIQTSRERALNKDSKAYSFSVTPTPAMQTVQVPEERLRRHRFNKSSVRQISHMTTFSNVDNFIRSSSKRMTDTIKERALKSSRTQRNNTKAKRFIKMKNFDRPQQQQPETINPYTQRQYLHVQLRSENEKMKSIERFIKSSIIETDMTKSFLVKTITPEVTYGMSEKADKKYMTLKQSFFNKVRSHSVTEENKIKNKKHPHLKSKNDELNGWEINQKNHQDRQLQIP